jgi:arginyl-tRNA synthetase
MAALSETNWDVNTITVDQLAHIYSMFSKRAEERPELQEDARNWFKRLEDGDPEATYLWELFRKTSIKEFEKLYERLGVNFTQFDGESNYSRAAQLIIEEAQQKGIAQTGEGGAILVAMEGKDPPCMLQKSDGATTYLARDVAAVINRFKTHGLSRMLYVVGHAQSLHFKQVFHVVKQLGYNFHDDCVHVPFGLLKFEGSKFSSRKGNMLLLKEVLDVAAEHVSEIVKEKGNSISKVDMDKIGIGAVTFADLSRKRTLDVNFKWEDILQFEGSTGPYLQYTLVRCGSIVDKSAAIIEDVNYSLLIENEEKLLLLKLDGFSKVLQEAAADYDPSRLCNYLLKLAKLTNRYIRNVRVIQENVELQKSRTALVKTITIVMDEGLALLGIARLQKM